MRCQILKVGFSRCEKALYHAMVFTLLVCNTMSKGFELRLAKAKQNFIKYGYGPPYFAEPYIDKTSRIYRIRTRCLICKIGWSGEYKNPGTHKCYKDAIANLKAENPKAIVNPSKAIDENRLLDKKWKAGAVLTSDEKRPALGTLMQNANGELQDAKKVTVDFEIPDHYGQDIYLYFKQRELKFIPRRYMEQQTELNCDMRAALVDWLVQVQEYFDLEPETLYSAVRLVDLYLSSTNVIKENLQLVGTAAMLISSKFRFEERCCSPRPTCDLIAMEKEMLKAGAYTTQQLIAMEKDMLKAKKDFDIGLPLSYSILGHYARVSEASVITLTLARFILETSLMEYDLINVQDSLMAASSLMMAFRIHNLTGCLRDWMLPIKYFGSFPEETKVSIEETTKRLHAMLTKQQQSKKLKTIHNKYSRKAFYEVAKMALPAETEC